jgi:hypothetical protein
VPFHFQTFKDILDEYSTNSENGKIVTVQELTRFLVKEQGEKVEGREVSRHMRDYLQDTQRDVQEPYFTTVEVN